MKKIYIYLLFAILKFNVIFAQFIVSEDNAANYSSWSNGNNLGFGFGAWDIWNSGSGGVYLASSTAQGFGDVNTSSKAFGMWGNPSGANQSNAQRTFGSNVWADGATFSIQIATAYRNGYKGIDVLATGWENVWNFNIGGDKYTTGGVDQTGWSYSQTSVFTLTVTQNGSNLDISLTRGSDSYTTTISNKTFFGFKLYVGSTNAGNDLNNLFFNNLKVSYADASKVPTSIRVDVQDNTTLNSDKTFNDLRINSTKVLTVAAGKQLTVSSALTNNGTLTLKSNSTDGTATLKTPASLSGTGTYSVEQYLGNQSWYVSSPMTGTVTPTNFSSIRGYDEASNTWPAAITTMTAGKGYITAVTSAPNTVLFSGTIHSGDVGISLTRRATSNADKSGFNLIGNPYPAYLDWTAVASANASKMPTSTMWYRTKVGGSWAFSTVNGLGDATPNNVSKYIPPMQAFWVRAKDQGTATLNLSAATMVDHGSNSGNKLKAPAAINVERQMVRIQVSNNTNSDELLFVTDANALNTLDFYDAPKMSNDDVNIPEISSIVGDESLVINALNSLILNTEMPLQFMTKTANSFSLRANQISNLPEGVTVILKDNLTNTQTDLSAGESYTFTSEPETTSTRFSILFKSASGTTDVTNPSSNMLVFAKDNKIGVQCNADQKSASVNVFNGLGQLVHNQVIQKYNEVLNNDFASGVYLVIINVNGAKSAHKVIVK